MKYLKIVNTIAFLIPIVVCISVALREHDTGSGVVVGLMSTMVTGVIQLAIGLIYLYKYPKEILIRIYFVGVLIFFSMWFFVSRGDWYWVLPPVLFLLLSYIIYSKREISNEG